MQNKAKKKNGLQPVYAPFLKGIAVSVAAAKRGLRVLGILLLFAFMGVLAGGVFSFNSPALRVGLNVVLLGLGCMLMFNEGSRQGENDVAFAEIALGRQNEGKGVSAKDRALCFHPGKGFFTALAGAAPLLLIALVYALMAQKQTYQLGALPSWVAAFEDQADIGQALAYYHETAAVTLRDILRVIVRLLLFPFMNAFGNGSYDRLYLLDRLSPLLCLAVPAFYGIGYLRGPYLRALVHGNIRMNTKRHNRKERKAREQRAQQNRKKELI